MSRDLYLSFSTGTTLTADNTSSFMVNQYYFTGTTIALENQFDSSVSPYFTDGYDVIFSAFTQNKAIWTIGLFDQPAYSNVVQNVATNAQLRTNSYYVTVGCGCGLVEVVAGGDPCSTTAYGEVVNVTPDQAGEMYVHHDLTQVTSIDGTLAPALPSIVVKAFNSNYPTSPASGDTVTATLYLTGVTYVTGGTSTGETTTYTDTITVTHPGWGNTNPYTGGTVNSPEVSQVFLTLPSTGVGIHRGLWRFELHVTTDNQSGGDHVSNKYARAYLINNTCG